jgi:hypothetical protein
MNSGTTQQLKNSSMGKVSGQWNSQTNKGQLRTMGTTQTIRTAQNNRDSGTTRNNRTNSLIFNSAMEQEQ